MDLNSDYKGRPTMLWIVLLIVLGVGIYYMALGLGYTMGWLTLNIDVSGVSPELAKTVEDLGNATYGGINIFLGLLTLIIAFLLYSGSKGGRIVFIIILIVSIIGNAFSLIAGQWTVIPMFLAAIICFFLLLQPPVKAYFKV